MSRPQTPRPLTHDYELGELVALTATAHGFASRHVCQVIGFRKEVKLRLLPIGGSPIVVPVGQVMRVGLPAGSPKPPQRRRRPHKRRPKQQKTAA